MTAAAGLLSRHAAKAAIGALLLTILVFPVISDNRYYQTIIILSLLLAIMASGWNIISGFAGYVSLGQTVFLGIGAYTTAILSLRVFGADTFGGQAANPFYFVPISAVVAGLFAAAIGPIIMRTRGHSFVILTIAFLFVMQLIVLNWTELTYGNRGISLPLPTWPREWGNLPFYYIFFGLLLISVAMSWWIRRTKFGMGLIAIREDEDKAAAVGDEHADLQGARLHRERGLDRRRGRRLRLLPELHRPDATCSTSSTACSSSSPSSWAGAGRSGDP